MTANASVSSTTLGLSDRYEDDGSGVPFRLVFQSFDVSTCQRVLQGPIMLERVDGDEQLFLQNTSDVLYNVNRPILNEVPQTC